MAPLSGLLIPGSILLSWADAINVCGMDTTGLAGVHYEQASFDATIVTTGFVAAVCSRHLLCAGGH